MGLVNITPITCFLMRDFSFCADERYLSAAPCCASLLPAVMTDRGMDADGLLCAVGEDLFRS